MNRLDGNALDQALAHAGDGVFVIGDDGKILVWNRAAERILGYPARDVLGRPCCDVFVGRDDKGNRLCHRGCHVMTLVGLGESVQNFDMQTQTKKGQPLWLNLSILVIPSDRPSGRLMVHLLRDITATKELMSLVQERLAAPVGRDEEAPATGALTRRELEILRLLGAGVNTRTAAERLHVSRATIRNHVQNIFGKLGVHSRLEAVAYASRHRLL